MAKRQRTTHVSAAFNYLVKSIANEEDPDNPVEEGFSEEEFEVILRRIRDTRPLNDGNDEVIAAIKAGVDLPFNHFEEPARGTFFGEFEGAYYGQRYRNNILGVISAESLNLRVFNYLVTRLRDGKILIGVTYSGMYGDYDGIRKCFSALLRGNYSIRSKTLKSISGEIGGGQPISLQLTYRKHRERGERKPLFGSSGVIAIKNSDFGADFEEKVADVARNVRGTEVQRKNALMEAISQGDLLELDADDIIGCSVVVREEKRQRTVYFLGENNFATKFPLNVNADGEGLVDREQVKAEMMRVMREKIIPLLV